MCRACGARARHQTRRLARGALASAEYEAAFRENAIDEKVLPRLTDGGS